MGAGRKQSCLAGVSMQPGDVYETGVDESTGRESSTPSRGTLYELWEYFCVFPE